MSDEEQIKVHLILPGGRRVQLGRTIDKRHPNDLTYQVVYPENVDWDEIASFMAVAKHDS